MYKGKWKGGLLAVLTCMAMVWGFSAGKGMVFCEAKESDAEKEVMEFVTSYYEAQTSEEIETLSDYVEDPEERDFQMFLIRLQTLFEHGFIGHENLCAVAYPLSDGAHWMVPVSSDWVFQDLDVTIPGMNVLLVGRNRDGELQIESYSSREWTQALVEEVRKLSLLEEVVDWNNRIAQKYNEVLAEYPDVAKWLLDVSNETDRAQAEAVQKVMEKQESFGEEESDGHENRYVVKEGDCLWSIAKEWLGDGMRWSGLYEANRAVIGENPDLLYVGIELQID